MTTPDFVLELRQHVGHAPLWMPGCTAVVVRGARPEGAFKASPAFSAPDAAVSAASASLEILVVHRADNGQWTPVTGIVDPGEEPAAAAVREVREETDVVAVPRRLLSVEVVGPVTYPNGDVSSFLDTAFLLDWVSGDPHPADGENSEARFVRLADLPPMNDRFSRVIKRALSGETTAHFVA